jgi:hypothetical protein
MKVSRTGFIASAFPSFLMLGLFYSLAIHMRLSLGAWPNSIGERGFSPALFAHAQITVLCFEILLLATVFVLPVVILVCLSNSKWRVARYLAFYGLVFFVCWGLMHLAPEPFLYWWRD